MNMRNFYFCLVFLFFAFTSMNAQSFMIDGTVEVQTADDDFNIFEFDKYIVIYTFMQEGDANQALRELTANSNAVITYAFSRVKPSKFGEFSVEVDRDGAMLVWCSDKRYESKIYNRRSINDGMRINLRLKDTEEKKDPNVIIKVEKTEDGIDKEELRKKGVEITGKRENRKHNVSQSEEEGGVMTSTTTIRVPYRLKKNTRVVVQPVWYDRVDMTDDRSDTVFSYGKVVYSDRTEYGMTQTRLMDFDNMRDTLQKYSADIAGERVYSVIGDSLYRDTLISRISYNESLDTIEIYLLDTLSGYDPDGSHPYPFGAIVAIGDYNTVLKTHTQKDDGERRSPLKFLDFTFKEFLPNKDDFYEKIADERQELPGELRLNFQVGKAEIIPNDSSSRAQLETLRNTFSEIINDPTGRRGLVGVNVYGMASPEGSEDGNKDLARRRAQYAINEIKKFTAGRNVRMQDPQVAPWSKVVDFLRADNLNDEADAIAEIINKNPNSIKAQNEQIYKLPYYSTLIKDVYLPKLRTVRYEYIVNFFGEPKPEVVLARYKADKKADFTRGEYWTLFNYIDNMPELEEVAKYALEKTRNTYDEDSVYSNGYWPYAACLLACTYIARDTVDLNVLAPFLDLETVKDEETGEEQVQHLRSKKNSQNIRSRIVEYINFPEVAANQLIMVLKRHNSPLRSKIPVLEAIMEGQGAQFDTIAAISKCMRGGYKVGAASKTEEEAAEVRNLVSATSVTNSVVINLAMDDPDDDADNDKYLAAALRECELLPDNAISDYIKSVAHFRNKNGVAADSLLANSFLKDLKMVAIANNDKDLKNDDSGYKVIVGALKRWKETMVADTTLTENHPFVWYNRMLDELKKGEHANLDYAKEALYRSFDLDKQYLSILNVSLKNDKSIANNEATVEILKRFRNEYKRAE